MNIKYPKEFDINQWKQSFLDFSTLSINDILLSEEENSKEMMLLDVEITPEVKGMIDFNNNPRIDLIYRRSIAIGLNLTLLSIYVISVMTDGIPGKSTMILSAIDALKDDDIDLIKITTLSEILHGKYPDEEKFSKLWSMQKKRREDNSIGSDNYL